MLLVSRPIFKNCCLDLDLKELGLGFGLGLDIFRSRTFGLGSLQVSWCPLLVNQKEQASTDNSVATLMQLQCRVVGFVTFDVKFSAQPFRRCEVPKFFTSDLVATLTLTPPYV